VFAQCEREVIYMENTEKAELKFSPIFKMLGVTILVTLIMVIIFVMVRSLPYYETIEGDSSWILAHLLHIPQFVIPFLVILWFTRGRPSEYGFNLKENPPVFTHRRMFGLGALFGLLMSLQYVIRVIKGMPLDIPQPVTAINVLGNMTFQWIVVGFSEETMEALKNYYFPGNVRELENIIEHAVAMARDDTIRLKDFPSDFLIRIISAAVQWQ